MEKGFIITLSGISGAGKTHFIKSIIDRVDNFEKLKAVTTRERRKDEIDGIDKFFLSFDDFNKKNNNSEMCVVNNVFGNMYGYYKSDMSKTDQGICLVTELYYKEVEKFKKEYPSTISVYVLPKDISQTIEKLKARNTGYDELNKRITDIKNEIGFFKDSSSSSFDIIVTNNYDKDSIDEFIKQVLLKINELLNSQRYSSSTLNLSIDDNYKSLVDNYANGEPRKNIIYTSFDGDDMHYLYNICNYEISRGNIPLNPETSLGYYVSTVSLGGKKIDVMKDCLTLEMLADKMSVYAKDGRPLSEGIVAEMLLWDLKKEKELDVIIGVDHLSDSILNKINNKNLKDYLSRIDPIVRFELFNNLLISYNEEPHQSAYIIANMANFKHIDWARGYCYTNNICPVSPQNILPLHFYENKEKEYLESRLELLRKTDRILLFIDRNNLSDDLSRLDPYSLAEIYYVNKYLKDKTIELIGWDEALVPKYNQNCKWSLTTNEDITIRKVLK